VLAVAAIAIVSALGVPFGALWLGRQAPANAATEPAPEEGPAAAVNEEPATQKPAPRNPSSEADTAVAGFDRVRNPPRATASARPRTVAAVRPTAEANTPVKAASVVASNATATASAPAAQPVAMAERDVPRAAAPEAPVGRLFESTEVDQSPRIATRVEPHMPGDLPSRTVNDVVVVRVLVSHTGHPFQVNVLRRSRLGRSLDDSVIAAVRQWTFSPARKRGEAVSCWFNLAVPLVAN